ncbi:Acyl-CoA synthetase (AMP-forming)/AMP-acid ligase II [Gemmobacter megaterium]|uniref:Acyl-CoA synthetase (AMP-forming)/AMP-acid ligase II n=1 Tax=Gemmobacter megaterium TaxID=1086013 RepID=A0A1N7P193_9RHOB|nr:class I adenylate-forming enzyme family protein [Gemmobacter megaterium]GGE15193.1 acetyl-CoA synthetase [Gemmobacter megaterium]SIT04331.1 Acyl-CoA synthetase (AMP-forming)/AMP-acid ligase II [Gemmobacter megaterium]
MSGQPSVWEEGTAQPCPAPFNMAAHVLAAADRVPDRIALQVVRPAGAERWSYARLAAAVRGTGAGFLAMGLRPGARIVMRLGNTVDFPVVFLGAIAAGLVPVPTSSQLTRPEVERILAEIEPDLVVAAPDVAMPDTLGCPVLGLEALRALRDHAPCNWDMGDPDRLAYLIYTSGTSGRARAVAHAHRAIWARRMMHAGWYGLRETDRLMHAGAFNWTYTLGTGLMDPWSVGAQALIPAEGVAAAHLPLLLRRFDATIFAAAPGVYRQMLRAAMPALPKLRHGLSAGEKLPDAVRQGWEAVTGTVICEALGMSEVSTFVSAAPGHPAPPGASGYPQPGRRLAVLDDMGIPVPRGAPGTLAVHRSDPGLFLGYLNQPAETAARFAGDWFVTGDTVTMAEDGAIAYLGRDDDMMNAGGYRVSPLEVERVMNGHPAIEESAAVEVEVRPGVGVIALFYAGQDTSADDLAAFAETRLARYKQPRLFIPLPAIPKGANNKLARKALRQGWIMPEGGA